MGYMGFCRLPEQGDLTQILTCELPGWGPKTLVIRLGLDYLFIIYYFSGVLKRDMILIKLNYIVLQPFLAL